MPAFPKNVYGFIALTGGGQGALDAIDGADLDDQDFATGVVAGIVYQYWLDEDSGLDESSPNIIAPNANAGDKRWILSSISKLTGDLDAQNHSINNVLAINGATTKSEACTLTLSEAGLILVSAESPYTITLPSASGRAGLTYHFIKTDANYNLITLDGDGIETFNYPNDDGTPKQTYPRLNTYCAEVTVISDGSNWQCINEKLGQVPMCRVYLGSRLSNISHDTLTLVPLDIEDFDIGSNFDATAGNYKFVVPIPGKYLIDSVLKWHESDLVADKTYSPCIEKNGEVLFIPNFQASASAWLSTFAYWKGGLAKDDYIQLFVHHLAGVDTVDVMEGSTSTFIYIQLSSKD